MVRVRRARRTGLQEEPVAGPRHQPGVSRSGGAACQRCCPAPSSTGRSGCPGRGPRRRAPVGQGAGELQCPGHQGEDAERLHAAEGGTCGASRAATSLMTASRPSVYACRWRRCSGRSRRAGRRTAAVGGVVAVPGRKVFTHVLLGSGAAGRDRAEAFALFAELVGDRGGDQVVLGWEVGVEGAVGQPGVGHERGTPEPSMPSRLSRRPRLDVPLPGRLLVLCPVPRRTLLRPPEDHVPCPIPC